MYTGKRIGMQEKTWCAKVVFCFCKCGLLPNGNLMLFKSKHLKNIFIVSQVFYMS